MYLKVHYSVGENTWSVNIVKANNILEAKRQYAKKHPNSEIFVEAIDPALVDYELKAAERKGMPVIDVTEGE